MIKSVSLTIGALLLGLNSAAALATPIAASTILNDFNDVIFGNATTTSDIEGASVIGGNFSGATIFNNPGANLSLPTGYGALNVFGNTSGNSININDGGSAYVNGSKGANVNFNGGGKYLTTSPGQISDFQTSLTSLSTSLSQLSATSTLPTTGNNETITATPNASGIAVFNISASALDSIPSYMINLNNAQTVIFNVSGTSINFSGNDESGVTGADNIIWNFYQATSVSLSTQIAGTILATGATVTNSNQIDGDLFANSWSGNGELHEYAFTGALPGTTTTTGTTSVVEASSVLLVAAGLAGLALMARRRFHTAEMQARLPA